MICKKKKTISFSNYVSMTRRGYKIKSVKEKEEWHNRTKGVWYEHEQERLINP